MDIPKRLEEELTFSFGSYMNILDNDNVKFSVDERMPKSVGDIGHPKEGSIR